MPSKWEWWVDTTDDGEFEYARSRDDAIQSGLKDVDVNDSFKIMEAQLSTAKKHQDKDYIPFVRTRNVQWVTRTKNGYKVGDE